MDVQWRSNSLNTYSNMVRFSQQCWVKNNRNWMRFITYYDLYVKLKTYLPNFSYLMWIFEYLSLYIKYIRDGIHAGAGVGGKKALLPRVISDIENNNMSKMKDRNFKFEIFPCKF